MDRNRRQPKDPLLRWLVGVAIVLAALVGVLAISWGPGPVIAVLPWYVPMMHSFLMLAALSIAFVSLGRYRALREPAPFWIGMAFGAFAVLTLFYVLSWPGLLPDERGLIAQLPNTAAWLWSLKFSALAILLLVAVLARWPQAGATGERWWPWLTLFVILIVTAIGLLSVAFERLLPLLVANGAWTALEVGWLYALLVAFTAAAVLSAHHYRQSGDLLFAYLAVAAVVFAFAVITPLIGPQRYDLWWYWQRLLWVGGFSAMLFGLLSDYVGLYRRERARARELAVLVDTAPVGIVFHWAIDRRPMLFNQTTETILGRPIAPELGITDEAAYYGIFRPSGEPFPPEELPASRALRGETCIGVEMLIRQPSGRKVYVLANSTPLRDAAGRITGAVVAFQDITPIKEQELLRDEFLSAAAHELKTPVTTIKGYAQLMREWAPEGHDERERQAFAVIDIQCNRINRRVQEMLEAVRFRRVPPELHLERFDLGELAFDLVQRMQTMTQMHRLLLQREGSVPVQADRERIEEVLVSLLDNAIKFSPQGGDIEVRVWAEKGDALVSVKDYGVGIPEERQTHVFEPFYEAVPSGAPGYRGVVALSLYLGKLAVERHGGHIWFESKKERGSTFYFSLPLPPAQSAT